MQLNASNHKSAASGSRSETLGSKAGTAALVAERITQLNASVRQSPSAAARVIAYWLNKEMN